MSFSIAPGIQTTSRPDFRSPTLVVLGFWNGAILNQPAWVLQHLLDVPEGQDREVRNVVTGDHQGPHKQIWLYEDFGLSIVGNRAEFYETSEASEPIIYSVLKKLVEALPHTPVQAAGVNFNFIVEGDLTGMVPNFDTDEPLDRIGQVEQLERLDVISVPDDELIDVVEVGKLQTALQFSRKSNFQSVEINFNYHINVAEIGSLSHWIDAEPIAHWKKHALGVLSDCYGIDEFEHLSF